MAGHGDGGAHKLRRAAMVCGTPLQLIGCIALATSLRERGEAAPDLFLRHDFVGSRNLVEGLRAEGIFSAVFEIGAHAKGLFSMRGGEKDELPKDARALLAEQLEPSCAADRVSDYAFLYFSYPYDTVKALRDLNPAAQLRAFDDGLGSYVGNIVRDNGGESLLPIERLYLWAPGLYRGELCDDVRSLHLEKGREGAFEYACRLFGVDQKDIDLYRGARCVYLTQPTDGKQSRLREKEAVLDALRPWAPEVVVRRHPRDDVKPVGGFAYDERGVPWELLCLSGALDERTVLLASVSTAQLMPKILLGDEPVLVVTERLSGASVTEAERAIVELMRSAYEDPSKIVGPETAAELSAALRRVLA